jgi:phage gp29-like protein
MSAKTGFTARLGAILNRAAASLSYRFHVAAANLWRDSYNPLRSLTIARAVQLLEDGERGAYADLQWTYRYIEMQDATLGALVERRTSAIQELDWDIKTRAKIPAGKEAIAAKQAAALENAYNNISNLSAAFEALAMATFRGFARLEKVLDASGNIVELAPVDQWFWVRSGLYGTWKYNATSTIGTLSGEEVDESRFVCREVSRPVNRVALIATVRKGASQKDWDGFIETFGIPAVFIIMPDNIPEGKEEEYLATAEQITSDARGALPYGADVKTVDNGARGTNPFKEHISYQDEQVVLRGTGGKLTMLAESGSGTLAGGAHSDTFAAIARAEAREISEILQQSIDAAIIAKVTPGERAYAYFELANEETDPTQAIADIVSLEASGLQTDLKWIEEKTGYPVQRAAAPVPPVSPVIPILNRTASAGFRDWIASVRTPQTTTLFDDLAAAAQDSGMSDADFAQRATDLISNLQALDPTAAADMAATMEAALGTAVAGAVTSHGSRVMSEDASASSSSPINP